MNNKQQIRLLKLWFQHYQVYYDTMDRKDRLAFLKKLIFMGKELQTELKKKDENNEYT